MEEVMYKRCKICGKYYDVRAENGYKLCNQCYLEMKIKEKQNGRKK